MTLYRATEKGNIPLSADEEAKIRDDWDRASKEIKIPVKSLEQRVQDLETAIALLSK